MVVQAANDGAAPARVGSSQWQETGQPRTTLAPDRRLERWIDALAKRGLRVQIDLKPECTVLHLGGRLDRQSAPLLKDCFREISALSSNGVDVDLGGVDRVDGVGLAALVWAWGMAREAGLELRLTSMRPYVREIVAKMNLHQLLEIVGDRSPV